MVVNGDGMFMQQETRRTEDRQRGMTLIEVLVMMSIIGILVGSILPMMVMGNKMIAANRTRFLAQQLVNEAVESTLGKVSPSDYQELQAPSVQIFTEVKNGLTFTITKTISWVDDPVDGTASGTPRDRIPFDYKQLRVTVSGINPLTNRDFIYADYKVDIAREGGEDPYAGIIIRVKHPGLNNIPVAGASCTLVATSPVPRTLVGATNDEGECILPLDPAWFPTTGSDKDRITFTVKVEKTSGSGNPWMMRPIIIDGIMQPYTVTAENWRTVVQDIQMEQSAELRVKVTDKHLGGTVSLINNKTLDNNYPKTKTLAAGQNEVLYTGLWPDTQYELSVNLKAWEDNFDNSSSFSRYKEKEFQASDDEPPVVTTIENMWKWNTGQWTANVANNQPYDLLWPIEDNTIESKSINLEPFKTVNPTLINYDFSGPVKVTWDKNIFNTGPVSPTTPLVYQQAGASDDWIPVASVQDILNSSPDAAAPYSALLPADAVTEGLKLRFAGVPDGSFSWILDNLKLYCNYKNANLTFVPNQDLEIKVN